MHTAQQVSTKVRALRDAYYDGQATVTFVNTEGGGEVLSTSDSFANFNPVKLAAKAARQEERLASQKLHQTPTAEVFNASLEADLTNKGDKLKTGWWRK